MQLQYVHPLISRDMNKELLCISTVQEFDQTSECDSNISFPSNLFKKIEESTSSEGSPLNQNCFVARPNS
ncbi:hypothetical protein D8674_031913 [Pyrus ussuriensis x Pyrus communis]|uniref:Uncharacterized protein n=1 Tax=Pyrus ussuriensis x Pyrus communis TaxID=2448454 RepID=A0A5N5F161_9ROSA|nr:hypothetical protein D8674_031913 [Pyrus ussuriensis x Pyrus communis]